MSVLATPRELRDIIHRYTLMKGKKSLIRRLRDEKFTKHKNSFIKWETLQHKKYQLHEYIGGIDWDRWYSSDNKYRNLWWYFASVGETWYIRQNEPPTLDSSGYSKLCIFCDFPEHWGKSQHSCERVWAYHPDANILWVDDKYIGLNTDNEILLKNYCWVLMVAESEKKVNSVPPPPPPNEWDELVKEVWTTS